MQPIYSQQVSLQGKTLPLISNYFHIYLKFTYSKNVDITIDSVV